MFEKRDTNRTDEELLLEALLENGIECKLRDPDDPPPKKLSIRLGGQDLEFSPEDSDVLFAILMSMGDY